MIATQASAPMPPAAIAGPARNGGPPSNPPAGSPDDGPGAGPQLRRDLGETAREQDRHDGSGLAVAEAAAP